MHQGPGIFTSLYFPYRRMVSFWEAGSQTHLNRHKGKERFAITEVGGTAALVTRAYTKYEEHRALANIQPFPRGLVLRVTDAGV